MGREPDVAGRSRITLEEPGRIQPIPTDNRFSDASGSERGHHIADAVGKSRDVDEVRPW